MICCSWSKRTLICLLHSRVVLPLSYDLQVFWKLSVSKLFTRSESELELNHDLGFQEDIFHFGDVTRVFRDPDGDSSCCGILAERNVLPICWWFRRPLKSYHPVYIYMWSFDKRCRIRLVNTRMTSGSQTILRRT